MESHKIYFYGVEIEVTGKLHKGEPGSWDNPSTRDEFEIYDIEIGGVACTELFNDDQIAEMEADVIEQM